MPAGTFTASNMPDVLLKQHLLFDKGRLNVQRKNPRINSAKAVFENQTFRTELVMTGTECTGVKVAWLKVCDDVVVDNSVTPMSCILGGAESESVGATIAPNFFFYKDFVVTNKQCNDLYTYEDKMAENMLKYKIFLEEQLNKKVNATLLGAAMPASDYDGVLPIGWTEDDPAFVFPYGESISDKTLSEMLVIADMSNIESPVWIGDATWQASTTLAKYGNNQGGEVHDTSGLLTEMGNFYFDAKTMNLIGADYGKIIGFDPGNVGIWTINEYDNEVPQPFGDGVKWVWREQSMNLKDQNGNPIFFDAIMESSCIIGNNGMPRLSTKVRLVLRGGVVVGPGECNDADTGIIYMKQGAAPEPEVEE